MQRFKLLYLTFSLLIGCFLFPSFTFGDTSTTFNSDRILVNYQLMDRAAFQNIIVGNTVVGLTRQSQSVYNLYFAEDGSCELWKQGKIYPGNWWIEKDENGRDFVRASWPNYSSSEPKSMFSPENSSSSTATSVWYYFDPEQRDTFLVATKKFRASVVLAPGRAFP